jgi:hypothetical protein
MFTRRVFRHLPLRYSVYYPSKVDCICLKLLFAC